MVKTKLTVLFKKKSMLLIMIFLIGCFVCACGKEDSIAGESLVEDTEKVSFTEETKSAEEEAAEQWEKGYGLLVDEQEEKEAENDCRAMMERIYDIYKEADKGTASNVVLSDEIIFGLQKKLMETGYPVTTLVTYSNMENYESVDSFLEDCTAGKSGSVVIYEIHDDGGIGRMKFIFDGTDMYVVSARTVTLTVDAVCDMVICDDALITHELTVRFAEDGSFQYLGNEILNDGIKQIPDYQYRMKE